MKILDERNDSDELYRRTHAGQTTSTEEWGVQFPNGEIQWSPRMTYDGDIRTPEGRKEFNADWLKRITNLNFPETLAGNLIFLKRVRTVKYSNFLVISVGD